MAGITLAQAEAQLTLWIAASSAVAGGQEYEIDTGTGRRKLKRADAAEIRNQVEFWDSWVKRLTSTGFRRIKYVVPEL